MARPIRLELAGALYHITSRGNRREDIFFSEEDRQDWLEVLGATCSRFNWLVHAFCQMTNHYHLLVETVDGNLSRGMRQLNGLYTQRFNRRHRLVGHLFQGRYKAILVQKDSYLLELSRYVVLNPLRARMVSTLDEWAWSSYPMVMGHRSAPIWLDTDWLLSQFGADRDEARKAYRSFFLAGVGRASPLEATSHQLILGDQTFIDQHRTDETAHSLRDISKARRRALALPLSDYQTRYTDSAEGMARAYLSGAYAMAEIAERFGCHVMTVSRAVKQFEACMLEC